MMKTKKLGFNVLGAATIAAVLLGCGQKYCDENDFRIEPMDGGKSAKIVKYVGNKQTVNIPPRLQKLPVAAIGEYAFSKEGSRGVGRWSSTEGMGIINVTIPNGVNAIEDNAFYGNQLTSVSIPNSVTTIGESAFESNQLTNINIGNKVVEIGVRAFAKNQLAKITIPNSVIVIGDAAFAENQLTSVAIPNSVEYIGESAFAGNTLTNLSVASGNTEYSAKGLFLLSKDGTEIIEYLGNEKDITIPEGVTAIENNMFARSEITSVVIPSSVTTIGKGAFSDNPLTNLSIAPGNTAYSAKGLFLLSKDGTKLIEYLGNEKDIAIPDGVTAIGNNMFARSGITSVAIPSSVVTIGAWAFSNNRLTSVSIPNSVTTIGVAAFANNSLTSITIGANVNLGLGALSSGFSDNTRQVQRFISGTGWRMVDERVIGAYNQNNREAGTYVLRNREWVKQ